MTIKILNLYAGIGGNRKLWGGDISVVAVENNPEIAAIYKDFFPEDEVIVGDAHQYLLEHFEEFDFIWSSPPCPSHSRIRNEAGVGTGQVKPIYPEMSLYQEIILLTHFAKCPWVIENVVSYYDPLIEPYQYKEHYFWANFVIDGKKHHNRNHMKSGTELAELKGFDLSKYDFPDKRKLLRNCTESETGKAIFDMAFRSKQEVLNV